MDDVKKQLALLDMSNLVLNAEYALLIVKHVKIMNIIVPCAEEIEKIRVALVQSGTMMME